MANNRVMTSGGMASTSSHMSNPYSANNMMQDPTLYLQAAAAGQFLFCGSNRENYSHDCFVQ